MAEYIKEPDVSERGEMLTEDWRSTGRVARDVGIVSVALGVLTETGIIPDGFFTQRPSVLLAVTWGLTVITRILMRRYGRYVIPEEPNAS